MYAIHLKITEIICTWFLGRLFGFSLAKGPLLVFACRNGLRNFLHRNIHQKYWLLLSTYEAFQIINNMLPEFRIGWFIESSVKFMQVRTQGIWKQIQWNHYFMLETLRTCLNRSKISEGMHENSNFQCRACHWVMSEWSTTGKLDWNGYHGKQSSSFETLRYETRF